MSGTINMAVIYGVIAFLSLVLAGSYFFLVQKKETLLLMIHCAVLVVNVGYLALSLSDTLEKALIANRIAYLGSVFLPLCMLLIIMNVCCISYNKTVPRILTAVSIIVFLIAASPGYLDIYYKSVSIKYINGAARLVKEYGPLHKVYYIYLFSYFGAMVGVILYSAMKKNGTPHKLAVFLAAVVLGNVGIWFVEQMISVDFEFLSVSYILTELLLVLLYSMLQDGTLSVVQAGNINTVYVEDSLQMMVEEETALDRTATIKETDEGNLTDKVTEEKCENVIEQNCTSCPEMEQLTAREKEVLSYILENKKRKDIAEELSVSENTIKKHTSHIFSKLGVANRAELFEKIKSV